ncbi:MAG: ATP-binding protein [Syntrophales bacterium LBB04]|nr:ATP-binding protein [Syntrophales bacterium LBB04]
MSEIILKNRFLAEYLPTPERRSLVLLTGARQTGKTTLSQIKYPQLRYINLDAPENREVLRNISTPSWSQTVGNAIIDEAQKEPTVFEKVKYAYDEKGISFCLLLGSSQILLLKKVRESLAGRVAIYELWPLMMSELFQDQNSSTMRVPLVDRLFSGEGLDTVFGDIPSMLLDKEEDRSRETEKYLLYWGGMPALLPLSDQERWKWLRDYEYTYLERDLSDLVRLDDLQPFTKFKRLSALRSGKLLNYSELARDASVSVDTARRYLEYLRLSYQVVLLQPYKKNLTSSVIKTPKLYWLDIGLLRQLSGQRGELIGEVYETMVVNELFKWIKTAQKNTEIYFYRTRAGLELDILLETENGFLGMEIKSRKVFAATDTKAIKEVAKALGHEWRGGLVVYQGNEIKKIAEPNIWAVPSRRLFI